MEKQNRHRPNVTRLEQCLLDVENLLGMQITLHDVAEIFHDPEGNSLLGARRHSHRRFAVCRNSPRQSCIMHCKDSVGRRAAAAHGQFTHDCRQGLREIVLPVKTPEGILLAVLFAGFWRARQEPKALDPYCLAAWRRLPEWNRQKADRVRRLLQMLVPGLIAETGHQFDPPTKPATRKAAVLQFIKLNASRPVRLADLARVLAISTSRASHLITESFGHSFQSLLMRERIARARLLLAYTDYSAKEIAHLSGMQNEYYFSRVFHRMTGMPPIKYRRSKQGSAKLRSRSGDF